MQTKPKGVRATHKEYDDLKPVWDRCSDVCDGQRAMHKAGERYLPKLTDETNDAYKARVARSDFFNASWRTIAGLVGMAFRKEPVVKVPTGIEPFLDDIDMKGTPLTALAQDLVEDVLEYGRIGLLVDHPPLPEGVEMISAAASEAMGQRPKMVTYDAEQIINWKTGRVGNRTVLTMVVLKECAEIAVSEFETKEEDRYRVLDLVQNAQGWIYRQREFRINDKDEDEQVGEDMFPLMNGRTMDRIPFWIIGAKGLEWGCDEPPLIDLIDKNVAHYQVNSDYRHGLHFTGLPTPIVAGYQQDASSPQSFYIGSTSAWVFPDPNAKASFLEFTGQGLGALRDALAGLEQQMALLGARMISDETKQAETLGATQIKRAGENSVLSAIVNAVSRCVRQALALMAEWAGSPGEAEFQISRDFLPVAMTAQEMTALVSAWQSGAISEPELFDLFKRGDIIDGAKALDEHQAEVEITAPAMPRPANAA